MNANLESTRIPPRTGDPIRPLRNDRGAVLALVVMLLIVLLGLAALAIDLGIMFVARGEAQRAADAGAHAGAGYLIHAPMDEAGARAEAMRVTLENRIQGRGAVIDPQIDVDVLLDSARVRVRVHRTNDRNGGIATIFARAIGFNFVNVSTVAAAEVWPATSATCVLPLAIPDKWCLSGDPNAPCAEGNYSDGLQSNQSWSDTPSPWYRPWSNPLNLGTEEQPNWYWTGYGDRNLGQKLTIKPQSPQGALQPGWFFPFRIPGNSGANDYRNAIQGCETGNRSWGVGEQVWTENGNMRGPTEQGFESLLTRYWDASWIEGCTTSVEVCTAGSNPEHVRKRIRPVALFAPNDPPELGNNPFTIVGFAGVFIDDPEPNGDIVVRFVTLTGDRPAEDRTEGNVSPLLKILRIVE